MPRYSPLPASGRTHRAWGALTGSATPSRLLLIEADEAVAAALSRALGHRGWTVFCASTATAGLRLQARWAPHVVLLAPDLPDMTAGELIARLAGQGGCGILVLSGNGDDDLRRAVLEQGAHDVTSKPIRASELAERLRAVQRRFGQPAPELLP